MVIPKDAERRPCPLCGKGQVLVHFDWGQKWVHQSKSHAKACERVADERARRP